MSRPSLAERQEYLDLVDWMGFMQANECSGNIVKQIKVKGAG